MADTTETAIYEVAPSDGTGWGVYTSTVDTNDTVTLANFTKLLHSYALRVDTLAAVTTTLATNVVTFTTAAMADVKVLVWVHGV